MEICARTPRLFKYPYPQLYRSVWLRSNAASKQQLGTDVYTDPPQQYNIMIIIIIIDYNIIILYINL